MVPIALPTMKVRHGWIILELTLVFMTILPKKTFTTQRRKEQPMR